MQNKYVKWGIGVLAWLILAWLGYQAGNPPPFPMEQVTKNVGDHVVNRIVDSHRVIGVAKGQCKCPTPCCPDGECDCVVRKHQPMMAEAPPVQEYTPVADGQQVRFGWVQPTEEQTRIAMTIIKAQQGGLDPDFAKLAKAAIEADGDDPVFFWEAELKVLKKILPSWDQGQIGSCVSHGWGRGVQDLILTQISTKPEQWPGAEVCREAIYGGSRVQIGGGRIGGDGSVGAWAAQWVQKDGIIFYQNYLNGKFDLTTGYSVQRCRLWGNSGCPKDLETPAREHPVQTVAMVKSSDEVWVAIGNGYPVPICSNVGFQSPLKDGFCQRSGSWGHCMTIRGRFIHPSKGKCFVIQNSWGDYLKSGQNQIAVTGRDGLVTLPQGCFGVVANDVDIIVKQTDSFAISAFKGFKPNKLHWLIKNNVLPVRDRELAKNKFDWLLAP